MSRYVDADKLINHLKADPCFPLVEKYGLTRVIDAQPTADVVEVVRCKDCRWYDNLHLCKQLSRFGSIEPLQDFYCGFGERKEQ